MMLFNCGRDLKKFLAVSCRRAILRVNYLKLKIFKKKANKYETVTIPMLMLNKCTKYTCTCKYK